MALYVPYHDLYDEFASLAVCDAHNLKAALVRAGCPLSQQQEHAAGMYAFQAFHQGWSALEHRMTFREIPDVKVQASASLRQQVFERDEFTCLKCGATESPLHADHVLPVFHGGETSLGNLQTLCAACNMAKGVDAVRYVSG